MDNIAFLGTGLLGGAFVEAALGRGDNVVVWNRTIAKAKALEKHGARVAASPAEAVRDAVRIHLVLTDDAIVDTVIEQFRSAVRPDAVIIDHSTTQPTLTAARAKRLNGSGVRYIHCPVFIGPAAARQGKGTILASGPEPLFREVEPALTRMAERVNYLGERPDLAAVHKLCGNAVWISMVGLAADVLSIAATAGVDPSAILATADFMNASGILGRQGERMRTKPDVPAFSLAMARKDVRLMQETAGVRPLSVLNGVGARMDALIAAGHGDEDLSALGHDAR